VTESPAKYDVDSVRSRILDVRGQRAILDSELAKLYGVPTHRFNEAVKRNRRRFPDDFAFPVTREEFAALISQNAISKKPGRGGRRTLPWVFTEHGALMAANVLNSPKAVKMSVFVVRAFFRMRTALTDTRELTRKLVALEQEVKARLDTHDAAIVDILARIMDMIDPPDLI